MTSTGTEACKPDAEGVEPCRNFKIVRNKVAESSQRKLDRNNTTLRQFENCIIVM